MIKFLPTEVYQSKKIILLLFLLFLSSCGDRCIDKDEFYDNQIVIYANPNDAPAGSVKSKVYGEFEPNSGGHYRDWLDTGLVSDGGAIKIWITGDIVASNGEFVNSNNLTDFSVCKYCFKDIQSATISTDNCYCGPTFKGNTFIESENPTYEIHDVTGTANQSIADCSISANQENINLCSCKIKPNNLPPLDDPRFISFSKDMYLKKLEPDPSDSSLFSLKFKPINDQLSCRHSMGYGLYISMWGPDGQILPQYVYHMFVAPKSDRVTKFCPVAIFKNTNCIDEESGEPRWVYVYNSPDGRTLKKSSSEYHHENEIIKINIYDQYYFDNKGSYKLQFISGVFQKTDKGLISGIVATMEDFLFGYSRIDNNGMIKKNGIIEFMYKSLLNNYEIKKVINVSFVLYVVFFGVGFFLGIVEMNRKEIMMRLLKVGLVMIFTNPYAWDFYNQMVVGFFKDGMNQITNMIVGFYTTSLELSYINKISPQSEVVTNTLKSSSNFLFVDALIRDLLSDPVGRKIWSLFSMKQGKGFFAVIYVPAIYFLIFYFIYAMIDIAIKYIVNMFKICLGLALGPVFIFFSLFEKTKDMFKNWLAFMGSRSFEIILLFAFIHPFITILEHLFKEMFYFKICPESIGDLSYILKIPTILKPEDVHKRSLFWWFEHFLKIAAMIFITRSVANKSAYISGQIISIGGISNADPVSEIGKGQSGFNIGSAIMKSAWEGLKTAANSQYIKGSLQKAGRFAARNMTSAVRSKVFGGKSMNDIVNSSLNAVGIRNRGIRSFARDQKIDGFISKATKEAEQDGLSGARKQDYIRQRTSQLADQYEYTNPNNSVMLGINDKNIEKRLDQKLVKEPMKDFIKQRASELKADGIIGKEAQAIIMKDASEWSKENIFGGQEKVAEFFKKTKMKSFLNKQSNMDAKEAVKYVKFLKERDGNDEKAKDFINKYRDAVNENAVRRALKERKNIEKFGALGYVGNAISKGSNYLQKVNPLSSGLHKSNPILTARKFDRKLKRMEMDEKVQATGQAIDGSSAQKENKFINRHIINNRGELFPIKKDDYTVVKALKAIPNLVGKPISKLIVKPLMNAPSRIEKATKVAGVVSENVAKVMPQQVKDSASYIASIGNSVISGGAKGVKIATNATSGFVKKVNNSVPESLKNTGKAIYNRLTEPFKLVGKTIYDKSPKILKDSFDTVGSAISQLKPSNLKKTAIDSYKNAKEKSKIIASEHEINQVQSFRRMGSDYKPDENQRFRDNRKGLEELIKKIDSSSSKDPENKSILEELNAEQRIFFQKEMNKKIAEIKDRVMADSKDDSKKTSAEEVKELISKLDKLEKLPNIIFNSKKDADTLMATFDQSSKDYLDDIYNKAKNFQKNQDLVSFSDQSDSKKDAGGLANQSKDSVSFENQEGVKSIDIIKYGENNLSTIIQDTHEKFKDATTQKEDLENQLKRFT